MTQAKAPDREAIEAQTAAFIERGGAVDQVPFGTLTKREGRFTINPDQAILPRSNLDISRRKALKAMHRARAIEAAQH